MPFRLETFPPGKTELLIQVPDARGAVQGLALMDARWWASREHKPHTQAQP
jgi:hypothetical protein